MHTQTEVFNTATSVVQTTFFANLVPKFVLSFFTVIYGMIVTGNETIIGLIVLLYILDLFIGIANALHKRQFESGKFFRGCTKFLLYGIFMVIGISIGESLHVGNMVLSMVFAFIVIRDSSSILENLEHLGYNTPMFLKKYLKVAQDKLDKQAVESAESVNIKKVETV